MDRLSEIMEKLATRTGMELGSNNANETEEELLERRKRICERKCEIENNQEGHLHEIDGYNCTVCKNKGYYVKPSLYLNDYTEIQCTCKCEKARKAIRALKRSGLADVVRDYTFDKYIVTDAWQQSVLDTAKRYLQNTDEKWFFFGGATGSGKSHICTAIAVQLIKRNMEVKYMLWRDEASKLKAKVNDAIYVDIIKYYKEVDVLYIDDLFKTGKSDGQNFQRPTQGDINLAFEIINSRYARKKITIISSECTLNDLLEIDEAVAGRIKQKCGDFCINIAPDRAKNYRLK